MVAIRERAHPGYVRFEAMRTGDGSHSCRYFDSNGTCLIRGAVVDGRLNGTWSVFSGEGEELKTFDVEGVELKIALKGDGFVYTVGAALRTLTLDEIEESTDAEFVKRVEAIEWGDLEGCYGESGKLGPCLIALNSPLRIVRNAALGDIEAETLHQGSVYETTAAVIPFLIELLESEHIEPIEILPVLRWYGEATYEYLEEAREALVEEPDDSAWAKPLVNIAEGLSSGWSTISKFLDYEEENVRSETLSLAQYTDEKLVRPSLEEIATTSDDARTRAIAVETIAKLPSTTPTELSAYLRDESLLVRTSTAVNVATSYGPESPAEVVAALTEALNNYEAVNGDFRSLPGNDTHLLSIISLSLGSIRSPECFALSSKLRENFNRVSSLDSLVYGQGLLALSFGRGEKPFAPDFVETLKFLANSEKFFSFNVNAYEILGYWNLPREPDDIIAFADEIGAEADPQEAMYNFFHGE